MVCTCTVKSSARSYIISSLPATYHRSQAHCCARHSLPGRLPKLPVRTGGRLRTGLGWCPVAPMLGSLRHMYDPAGLAWGRWVMLCADPRGITALIPADDANGRTETCALKCCPSSFYVTGSWSVSRSSTPLAWRGAEGSWGTLKETVMGELRCTRHHG